MVTNPTNVTVTVPNGADVTGFTLAAYTDTELQGRVALLDVPKPASSGNTFVIPLAEFLEYIPENNRGQELHLTIASRSAAGAGTAKEASNTFKVTGGIPAQPTSAVIT